MVAQAANTTCSILRGTTTNDFGDVIDANTVFFEGIPAILIETGRKIDDPSSPTPRTIRAVDCHLPESVHVLNTDRILDERTRDIYIILSVTRPPDIFGPPAGLLLALKRVTAAGP